MSTSPQHLAFSSQSSSPNAKEMSGDNFEAALKILQMRMDSRSRKMQSRLKSAEKHIKFLQVELEESMFLDELDDPEEYNSELHEIRNKLQLSEKRTNIAQQQIIFSDLREKDWYYRNISLEQVLTLYQHRLSFLESRNASCEEQNKAIWGDLNRSKLRNNSYEEENKAIKEDLKRTRQELKDTMHIVTESIERVEFLEAKIDERETSLNFAQQLLSSASEEANTAKIAAKVLQAALTAAETKHAAEVANLSNELQEARRENNLLIASLQSDRSTASDTEKPCSSCLKKNQVFCPREAQSLCSDDQTLEETKACLDVCSQLSASETLVNLERKTSEALQASLTATEEKHALEIVSLSNELEECRRENRSLNESVKSLQSSAAQHIEVLTNNITDLETANKQAVDKIEKSADVVKCQLSALEASSESEKKISDNLQLLVKQLQEECASLRSEVESTSNELRCCRQTLTNKEEHIVELESLLSYNDQMLRLEDSRNRKNSEEKAALVSMQSRCAEFDARQQLEDAKKSLEHAQITPRDYTTRLPQLEQSHTESSVTNSTISLLGQQVSAQQASILELQRDNDILMEELMQKDSHIAQLNRLKEGLERDLCSVKSILEVAQNEAFTFCETVLQSQYRSNSLFDSSISS